MLPACTDTSGSLPKSRRGGFLLKSEVFSDVCVRVGDSSFPCHKIVLASASEYFEKWFANEGLKTGEVTLTETTPCVFKTFLNYIYTWNEDPLLKLQINELVSLLQSSHMWMAVEVEKTCEKIILDRCALLQPKELIQIYGVAYLLEKKSIMDGVIKRMQFLPMDHPEIYNLQIDCFTEYFKHTNSMDEGKRFDMAEKWILKNRSPIRGSFYSFNWNSRFASKPVSPPGTVARILENINFKRMSLHEFYNGPGKSKLLADSRKVEIIYKIACKFSPSCS